MSYKFNPFTGNFDDIGSQPTGWAQYFDTQYTTLSPFEIEADTIVTVPNNAGSKIEAYLPIGVESFYDEIAQTITPAAVGDYNLITVRFKAIASHSQCSLDFGIDIGGTQGIIFGDVKVFPKGAGVEHSFSITSAGFSLATFVANGGMVKLAALGGDIDIWGIEYQIARVHNQ